MAAYASTVATADSVGQVLAGTPLRVVRGRLTITNYNSTLVEITGITKFFRTNPTVLLGGKFSSGLHSGQWIDASKSVKAFVDTTGAEVANDVTTMGNVPFVAIGVAP